jgi:N6-adenosine-specific RNA methylase IME4
MIHDRERGANKHYPTATLETICNLKPPVADDAILLLWTISSHFAEALQLISAWGFTLKTKAWTWVKITKKGKPRMGMGYWTRQCTEDCLLATRGKPPAPKFRGELALIQAPRLAHSVKPLEQYDKINRLFPDTFPRLEMFARLAQPGWDVFGNDVENSVIFRHKGE